MAHTHVFRERRYVATAVECACGEEGQACEACGKCVALSDCHADAEGVWLCAECYAEEEAAVAIAPSRPEETNGR